MQNDSYAEARSLLSSDPQRAIQLLAGSNVSSEPEALFIRGVAFFRLGDFSSAESSFRGAIAMDAMRADAFYYLGLTRERRGNNAEALKAYRVAVSLDPSLSKAREKLAQLGAPAEPAISTPRPMQRRPLESELTLPDEDTEFEDYERRRRRKAVIDTRAGYHGQFKGMPVLAQAFTVVFFICLFGFFAFVFYNLVTR
ncbi:MAG TPA: tetratricopeptide repeat protein [Actinomycetota bacterium]|nr:tetratricopeptide repeat protein [Actinomycetota bacterium]